MLDEVRWVLQNICPSLWHCGAIKVLAVSLQPVAHSCQLTVYGNLTLVVVPCCSYSFTSYLTDIRIFCKHFDSGCDQSSVLSSSPFMFIFLCHSQI